jgi:hypothetical protein
MGLVLRAVEFVGEGVSEVIDDSCCYLLSVVPPHIWRQLGRV